LLVTTARRLVRRAAMEFGLFIQAHVPISEVEANPEGAEHARLMREADLAVAVDAFGFKYVWSVEHHFLEEYSHISASEIVLPWIAARTKRLHVGSAIWNITPPVNHPARIAERVAMLDHLSEGRFEFGTGRGSSSTEFKGFRIPDGETTRAMYDEALPEILRMWKTAPYAYDGTHFSMPERNVIPKPYSKPHPPIWVACGSPSTFEKAGRLGLGALCFSLGSPKDFEPLIKTYKNAIRNAEPIGDYVNDNVVCVSQLVCQEDGRKAREYAMNMGSGRHQSLVFRYLDTFPRPPQVPPWPQLIPDPTPAQLEERIATGQRIVGNPDECAKAVQKYVDVGCDQLVFGILATTLPQEACVETCRLFGTKVIPRFDTDPVHSTTRYREAALANATRAAAR
jgi:alkanesulfonate monooxygenase SsuD/methylene tetrahydromethanopterin reductase-like flavin-dependent oxidoreductase (luciferase family)